MLISILLTKALGLVQVHHFPGVVLGPPEVTGAAAFSGCGPDRSSHTLSPWQQDPLPRHSSWGRGGGLAREGLCLPEGGRAWREVSPEASTAEF